ncbi:helix-turn-helix domain-containing protein [Mesorhizobium sp. ArgA1]
MDRVLSAEQLRAARSLLNWSRVRLAAKANLSEMTISEFENGIRKPRTHIIAAVRRAFGKSGNCLHRRREPIASHL